MSTCNLVEIVHNKWLQQADNKMICLYETMVDDLICAFMQFENYKLWLKDGSIGNEPNSTSLKLKSATRCVYPKILTNVIKLSWGKGS